MRIDRIAARTWELSSTTKIRMVRREKNPTWLGVNCSPAYRSSVDASTRARQLKRFNPDLRTARMEWIAGLKFP